MSSKAVFPDWIQPTIPINPTPIDPIPIDPIPIDPIPINPTPIDPIPIDPIPIYFRPSLRDSFDKNSLN
jgi:hypothetical protein